ncbi:MAG: toll/interleukin-1 receptor domain-containing protein [Deltaproteobacteria bacterium]
MAKIFLSHNSNDKIFTRALYKRLKAKNHDVWLDEIEIPLGGSIVGKIFDGIEDADFVIAIISKNSVSSNWVKKELYLAMHKEIS